MTDSRPFSAEGRAANLAEMAEVGVDLLVVGGGITGAGVALEAVRRGLRVGLVEARDFASGTSSRSSKLVHGGFRYLAQGEVGLVREALHERGVLTRTFPGLVHPIPFLLPVPRSRRGASLLKAGLVTYDMLAVDSGFPRHRRIDVEEARAAAPALQRSDIRGAWLYYDAQTDDARLTLTVLRLAADRGARVANYAPVVSAQHYGGRWRVTVADRHGGRELEVEATYLVNCGGVWAEAIEGLAGRPPRAHLRPSKGVHLSLDGETLPIQTALVFPTGDGRLLFAIPWHQHVVIGTTDSEYHGDIESPACTDEEAADLLGAVNRFFGLTLSPGAIRSRWAGVRPLVSHGEGKQTKDLSRKPFIELDDRGLLTVTGGKLTTFRRMAADAVDMLPAAPAPPPLEPYVDDSRPARLERLVSEEASLAAPLGGDGPHRLADVALACDEEMALELDDVLSRRLRLSFVDVAAARRAAPMVAEVMARRLGWADQARRVGEFDQVLRRQFGLVAEELPV
jgi:glycerol-3-phosphate dehydrogenase